MFERSGKGALIGILFFGVLAVLIGSLLALLLVIPAGILFGVLLDKIADRFHKPDEGVARILGDPADKTPPSN